MSVDGVVLLVALVLGVLGALSGAARQVANLVALVVAGFAAPRLGSWVGPRLAEGGSLSRAAATVLAGVLVFAAVWIAARYVLVAVLERVLVGEDGRDRSVDRWLGFSLGALKGLLACWVVLSAVAFVGEHVKVAGKRLGLRGEDSWSVRFADRYNLFEMTQFASLEDLVRVAQAERTPEGKAALARDPAFKALKADPRFARLLRDPRVARALLAGDREALLRSDAVLQLVQDKEAARRLEAAADAAER